MTTNKNYNTISEEDAQRVNAIPSLPKNIKRRAIAGVVIGIASALVISSIIVMFTTKKAPKRNVIMMISDGFGPASETYARQYHQWREGLAPKSALLPLDEIHVGHSRTQSASSLVTDSAAGATAFACGQKSYNGAIGVTPDKNPCGTVLESAKHHRHMLTGLVVTSRISHATPSSFNSHVVDRNMEPDIAAQQIGYNPLGRSTDLMFGGGACEFISNATQGSCRHDQRDLYQEAQDHFGWTVKHSRQEFDAIRPDNVKLPLMAVFTPQHMSYEIDRNPSIEPSLKEMSAKALSILSAATKDSDNGFFLMIEGSRIDMAAHSNDAAAHLYEIMEYQHTIELVKEFVRNNPDTVLISTSDHETGGLTVGRQVGSAYPEYKWQVSPPDLVLENPYSYLIFDRNPEVISHVMNSSEALASMWNQATEAKTASVDYLKKNIIADGLGVADPSPEEIETLMTWKSSGRSIDVLATYLSDIVSRRALIGFTTWGHTAVDVNLYALGEGTESLRGSHENTEIGDFIVDYLGLDLKDITQRLNNADTSKTLLKSRSLPDQLFTVDDFTTELSDHERFNN